MPEGLIAQLHGKGSMSEVLRIERQRLMEQAAEEMRVQLGGTSSGAAVAAMPKAAPALEVVPQLDTYQPSKLPMPGPCR